MGMREPKYDGTILTAAAVSPMTDTNCATVIQKVQVLERVTPDNFDARRYVLANRDLKITFGDDEAMAEAFAGADDFVAPSTRSRTC